MPNSNTKLSIIIVNYRSEQYLKDCVASLFNRLPGLNFEIIVVNNDASNLGFLKGVKIINNAKNLGFGAANNQGAKKAAGEFLLFLNPDAKLVDNKVAEVLQKFAKDDRIAVIGPRLLTEKWQTQPWCAGKEASIWRNIKNKFGLAESKEIWESQQDVPADWVSGAAMFVKKEAFDLVGGFDEGFFMYFEDDDLCRRMRMAGQQVIFCPEFTVLHRGGKSRKNKVKQKIQYYRSFVHYLKKKNV